MLKSETVIHSPSLGDLTVPVRPVPTLKNSARSFAMRTCSLGLVAASMLSLGSCRKEPSVDSAVTQEQVNVSNPLAGITTKFVKAAELSASQQMELLALAGKCGIAPVSEIRTYYIHPTSDCGISIKSAETVEGRKITYTTVTLRYKDHYERYPPDEFIASAGEFRIRAGHIRTTTLNTFISAGNTIRVDLSPEVPLRTADRIIELLAQGKVHCEDETMREELEGLDLSRPEAISGGDGKEPLRIGYSRGQYCWPILDCELQSDGIKVTKVVVVLS